MPARYEITFRDRNSGFSGKEHMRCPECNSTQQRVRDSGAATYDGLEGIGRKRQCHDCSHIWRTIEIKPEALDDYEMGLQETITRLRAKLETVRRALNE